ncbi:MAG: hypothetical protein JWO86_3730 [Myxococcaceae bacterium]|nr:hypothetical protein [Myxococcaceae bacterium]MEA2753476.1 hypothetical protein [Myxococcales bacterium]
MILTSAGGLGRLVTALAFAGGTAAVASACSDEQIVLATLPPGFDGGNGGDPKRCVDSSECSTKEFCSRVGCGDVAGSCELAPVLCEEEAHAVCGCDGITYWNDCLRRAAGVSSMTSGECGYNARSCGKTGHGSVPGPDIECPQGTYCARLLSLPGDAQPPLEFCASQEPGTCWAIPAACPEHGGPDRWTICGSKTGCTSTCDAIRSGAPYKRAKACP